jgi:hypothetical protein
VFHLLETRIFKIAQGEILNHFIQINVSDIRWNILAHLITLLGG